MQFTTLAGRLAINPKRIREWIRGGIVLPSAPPGGRGRHNEYDDASLVCAALAGVLDELHVTVAHYKSSFLELHNLLRARSSLDWPQCVLDISPTHVALLEASLDSTQQNASIKIDLSWLCKSLQIHQRQQSLGFVIRVA